MSREAYRIFCREHPEMPVFFQDWYLDAVCTEGEWGAWVTPSGEKTDAVCPYFLKEKYGFRYITMPQFVKFMGPWQSGPTASLSAHHVLLNKGIEALPSFHGFQQNMHYSQQNWLPFYWAGFRQETRYTYLLSLEDLEQVFQEINRNMRRNILKAQKEVRVELVNDPERFFPVSALSFQRKGLALPYSRNLFLRHDASLAEKNQRQIFFATDAQGRTHSAAYLIWDRKTAYYHLSGDDPERRQSGAGILLIWEAIRYAREELGITRFDFEGSMLPEVEAIRRQFGARQQPYFYIWKYPSKLLEWLQKRR
ncbi:MAG: hypothetical protein KIPDCIKN_00956 [Haliscomenobacter sp.]|jgi:hypothetical protein|nr:hypothetical protein [Haliscomenobacter sp.]